MRIFDGERVMHNVRLPILIIIIIPENNFIVLQ